MKMPYKKFFVSVYNRSNMFFDKAKNEFYYRLLFLYYHPKHQIEIDYVNDLFYFGTHCWKDVECKFNIFMKERDDLCKYTWLRYLYKLDFKLCFLLLGAEEEDYFSSQLYKKSWNYRKRCILRQKLNFIKYRANNKEIGYFVDSKEEFAVNWAEEYGREWVCIPDCKVEEFVEKFKNINRLIAKPTDGICGRGIEIIDIKNNLIDVYNQLIKKGKKLLVEEYIYQKGFLHEVNPSSLNTIRIITIRHPDRIDAIFAYFRAGGKNAFVDNIHSGGVRYPIHLETGIMEYGTLMNGREYKNHPSTNIKVCGEKIPYWDKVLDVCKKAHTKAPIGINLIGWDVCLSGQKIYLIEGNLGPGFSRMAEDADDWKNVMDMLKEWENINAKISK